MALASHRLLGVGGGDAVRDVQDEGVTLLADVGLAAHGVGRCRRGATRHLAAAHGKGGHDEEQQETAGKQAAAATKGAETVNYG